MNPKSYIIPLKCMSVHVLRNYMFSVLELIIITKTDHNNYVTDHSFNSSKINKLYLHYMYLSIYIRGQYNIFHNYLYLKKNPLFMVYPYIL